jgi:hypothetical protein
MDMLAYFLGRLAGGGTGGSGGNNGPIYTDLVYNEDGTFTFFDEEGNKHTAECEYVDGRLEKIVLDGVTMDAVYKEGTDKLIKFGDMDIIVDNYSSSTDIELLDHIVTFTVDGEPYEVVSVKNGNSVNAPATKPTSGSGSLLEWQMNGAKVDFPYPVENDVEFVALLGTVADEIYLAYNVSRKEYPYLVVYADTYNYSVTIYFAKSISIESGNININPTSLTGGIGTGYNHRFNLSDVEAMKKYIIESNFSLSENKTQSSIWSADVVVYANFDKGVYTRTFINI